ncbi:hypothetical protein BGW80DRAFT_1308607, partial [Lactifluus volemus]
TRMSLRPGCALSHAPLPYSPLAFPPCHHSAPRTCRLRDPLARYTRPSVSVTENVGERGSHAHLTPSFPGQDPKRRAWSVWSVGVEERKAIEWHAKDNLMA